MEKEEKEEKKERRKGRPLNKPIISRERAVFNHIMLTGTLIILVFGFYIFVTRSKQIIRFSYEQTLQIAKNTAFFLGSESVTERDAKTPIYKVSAAVTDIWYEEERKETIEYSADERVVYYSHFKDVSESREYKELYKNLMDLGELSINLNSLSLVYLDEEKDLMVTIVSDIDECGYARKIEGFYDEGVSHKVYVPVYKGKEERDILCYVYAEFDSGNLFKEAFKGILIPMIVSLIITLISAGYYYFKIRAENRNQITISN
jgi:hypothetical protein